MSLGYYFLWQSLLNVAGKKNTLLHLHLLPARCNQNPKEAESESDVKVNLTGVKRCLSCLENVENWWHCFIVASWFD